MKPYPREVRGYAIKLIERYPAAFSTDVGWNMKILEPILDTNHAKSEKTVDVLASAIAQLLESKRPRGAKPLRARIRKKAKKQSR